MVILTDYIRLADLPNGKGDELPLTRIGVVPIFEVIRRSVGMQVKAAVLTGSLVIIPKHAQKLVEEIAMRENCQLKWRELAHDPAFIRAELNAGNRHKVVSILTEVFTKGEIDVLDRNRSASRRRLGCAVCQFADYGLLCRVIYAIKSNARTSDSCGSK